MPHTFSSYHIDNSAELKHKIVTWANGFAVCAVLDSCNYGLPHFRYEFIAGVGVNTSVCDAHLSLLTDFEARTDDWIFGHYGFDTAQHASQKFSGSDFSESFFFIPEVVLEISNDTLHVGVLSGNADKIAAEIFDTRLKESFKCKADFKAAISKDVFIASVAALQRHIRRGDCYEINFCQEFYSESVKLDPAGLYHQLTELSPNPFSAFYKIDDQYALCASPERYVQKSADKLISQPIKGTAARVPSNQVKDAKNRLALQKSEKDRRENVIVVDLVRNDMSRVCEAGSVKVDELFGIYDFPSVFQMVSTVSGRLSADKDLAEVLDATFPMGSMTGAPKKKVLELIDQYEPVRRGLYSGTIGYINPEKNFDFNVVIRTLFYNGKTGYLSYFAGAGITDLSDPEQEYEECLLKAAVLEKLFH
jgi:para-aminobenzoate synthetase component 1